MASLVQNNNEHSLTSPEQKCTGEFGALAGDKSPSLSGTTNRGLWKVYSEKVRMNVLACMVLHNICLTQKDTIPKKLDLSVDPSTNEKRDRETVRELLQMKACRKVKDTSKEAGKIRSALVEKLWLEKETGEVW